MQCNYPKLTSSKPVTTPQSLLNANSQIINYTAGVYEWLVEYGGPSCEAAVQVINESLCMGLAKPYIFTVYDRIYGDFPDKNNAYIVLANPTYVLTPAPSNLCRYHAKCSDIFCRYHAKCSDILCRYHAKCSDGGNCKDS